MAIESVTIGQSLDCGIIIFGIIEDEIPNSMVLWPAVSYAFPNPDPKADFWDPTGPKNQNFQTGGLKSGERAHQKPFRESAGGL
jgi:hypothetical protein